MLGALLQTVTRTDRQVQDGSDVVVDGEHVLVDFVNRFHALSVQDGSDVVVDGEQVEVHLVAHKVMIVCGKACKGQRMLRVALWYFSGLGSERIQRKEVAFEQ